MVVFLDIVVPVPMLLVPVPVIVIVALVAVVALALVRLLVTKCTVSEQIKTNLAALAEALIDAGMAP